MFWMRAGLLLLGHRYYDPGTGKFLTRDPIGYQGGANLYAFCGGNPVNESDPDGWAPRRHHHGGARSPFYVQPQTIIVLDGALLMPNTVVNVDDDGLDLHHSHYGRDISHSSDMSYGVTVDPGDVPYVVNGDTNVAAMRARNHGFSKFDFGVIIFRGKMAGGPALDGGHSIVGEASVNIHRQLGHPNVGRTFNNAIEGATSIAFPGSGVGFRGPYTQQNIEAHAALVYNKWAASHPAMIKQYGLPATFGSH